MGKLGDVAVRETEYIEVGEVIKRQKQSFLYRGYVIKIRKQKPVGLYIMICEKTGTDKRWTTGAILRRAYNMDSIEQGKEFGERYIDILMGQD